MVGGVSELVVVYIISVIIYFYITYHCLPLDLYHSWQNTLLGFTYQAILFWILGIICYVLEEKGIIKPPPPKTPPPVEVPGPKVESHVEVDHSANVEAPPPEPPPSKPPPRPPTVDEMLCAVDQLDGVGFERWCSQILSKIGFSDVQLTKASGDQGVDIIAVKDDIRYAFQCKCYSSDIGNHPIQEVHAGKSVYKCHVGVVITNRYFTPGAKELAKVTGILLWDRNKLKALIQEVQNKSGKA